VDILSFSPSIDSNIISPDLVDFFSTVKASNGVGKIYKVLYYGQSIIEQNWSVKVSDYLRLRFGAEVFEFANSAIGAHLAERLVKTAESDVYPSQPDLIILHVNGSHFSYEKLVSNIVKFTSAELIIANDHVTHPGELREFTNPWLIRVTNLLCRAIFFAFRERRMLNWRSWINNIFIRRMAYKYNLSMIDVRYNWKQYVLQQRLAPVDLTVDGAHLNDIGNALMERIFVASFDSVFAKIGSEGTPKYLEVSAEGFVPNDDGSFDFKFTGTKIELVLGNVPTERVKLLIDSVPPTQMPGGIQYSRSTHFPGTNWPVLLRVGSAKGLRVQGNLSFRLFNFSTDRKEFEFTLTINDGDQISYGNSREGFLVGDIVVAPDDWNVSHAVDVLNITLPDEFIVSVAGYSVGVDELNAESYTSGQRSLNGRIVLLAQQLPLARHLLHIDCLEAAKLHSVRIYSPQAR